MKILRLKDRLKITVGDVKFWISPINAIQKKEIAGCTKMQGGKETFDLFAAQMLYLKYGLKKIEGIKDYNDKDYELEFDGDYLSDESVSEIMTLECSPKFLEAAWSVFNGITGEKIEGAKVEVEPGK